VLSLPKGLTEGVIQNQTGAANFSTFALFSPDGRLILTTGALDGRMQLWKAPTVANRRGHEVRQWVSSGATFTCAAFAPDGSFAVSGTKDRQVLVWSLPSREEIDRQITAEVSLVDQAVESGGNQVRVWAEFDNPKGEGRLRPGTPVTLVINPTE
jgi:WD40 repeat protein